MKKFLIVLLTLFLFFLPNNVKALVSMEYKDIVSDIVNVSTNDKQINIYLFYGDGCPHCAKEKVFLKKMQEKYKDEINIYQYEVWYNQTDQQYLVKLGKRINKTFKSVPLLFIGEDYYVGYSTFIAFDIENTIRKNLGYELITNSSGESATAIEIENDHIYNIPFLGIKSASDISIPILAIVLGLVDGFNPCAMWILLFLINILLGLKSRKKMFLFGFAFLFTSAFVYFLSMLGINFVLGISSITIIRDIIAVVALIVGITNLYNYFKTKDETGCHVVDDKKRKRIISKIKAAVNKKNVILGLTGIIILAASVNIIELACSLGFPAIFAEILALNHIHGIKKLVYILIYIFFYMFDDMLVFTISIMTLKFTAISTKFNKYSKLICGIIMILMGLLLLIKPEILLLNM